MSLVPHVKVALRLLIRNPVSSLALILTLGLGIAVNSVVFTLADAVLLRPLPFPEPDRLVAVYEAVKGGADDLSVADGNFFDLKRQATTLSHLAAYGCSRDLITVGLSTYLARLCGVTGDFLPALGTAPALGRVSKSGREGEEWPLEAVIGHAFWQTAFGGDPQALGRTVVILGQAVPVVGVMPKGFSFPAEAELWVRFEPLIGPSRTAHNLQVLGRLAPGASLASARSEMSAVARRLAEIHGAEIGDRFDVAVKDLHADLVGRNRATVLLLWATAGAVLLVACGNIAGILLARSFGRVGELAVRQALGATRLQLAGQLLVEGALFGMLGALVGLAMAGLGVALLNPLLPGNLLPSGPLSVDLRLAVFSLGVGAAAGLLCGLPVLELTRRSPLHIVQRGQVDSVGGGRPRKWVTLFVVAQYAFSLAALVLAGLFVRSLDRLLSVDPGFATHGLVTAEITLPTKPPSRYSDDAVLEAYYEGLLRDVAALPGVRRATLSLSLPFVGTQINGLALRETDPMPTADQPQIYPDYRVVGAGYFETMGIPLVLGREFTEADAHSAEPVAVVNRTLARAMWGESHPLDQRLRLPGLDSTAADSRRLLRVVGVVPEVRHAGLNREPRPAVYVPWTQHRRRAGGNLAVIASIAGRPQALVEPIRKQVAAHDPQIPLGRTRTMEQIVHAATSKERFRSWALGGFAGLALLLAVLGVYGAMAYSFSRREREMAVRLAIGASPRDIHLLALRDGIKFVLAGQVLATVLVLYEARLVQGLLFGVQPTDPFILGAASAALALIVLVTCGLAARRVSQTDPSVILKQG